MEKSWLCGVVMDAPLTAIFSYQSSRYLTKGTLVSVPFGPREQLGVVMHCEPREACSNEPYVIKPIRSVIAENLFTAEWLALITFAAQYYCYPFAQALLSVLPKKLKEKKGFAYQAPYLWMLTEQGRSNPPPSRAKAQLKAWSMLDQSAQSTDQLKTAWPAVLKWLRDKQAEGDLGTCAMPAPSFVENQALPLNAEQQAAKETVLSHQGQFTPFVLFGVTGSGKTEVYLQLISPILQQSLQVLVLVPEINLTPQLIERFQQRFPNTSMVMLHSEVADKERAQAWCAAKVGDAQIVIGTRLSVFTPLPKLGLVIVDEEHDASFKQQEGFKYHARDLAVWRAKQANVPVVMGSATPSLESLKNVEQGRYRLLTLRERACEAAVLPDIHLIDTRHQSLAAGLSAEVIRAIDYQLQKKQLSLVFINRRGFAPVLSCPDCGWLSHCPACATNLVLHLKARQLRCHHCGLEQAVPRACPDCGSVDLQPLGEGTQKIEEAIQQRWPAARCLRIDRDTTASRHAWTDLYQTIRQNEVDILIGTQMLAKGHDFSQLNLVACLGVDGGLYSADFRASENLFAMLTQVAGRAGRRGQKGQVLIQTQWPDHPLYLALQKHDFVGFSKKLLEERQTAALPPYYSQAILRADAFEKSDAVTFLEQIRDRIQGLDSDVMVWGPAPSLLARLAHRYRMQLFIESASRASLHRFLQQIQPVIEACAKPLNRKLRWSIDADPLEL